MTIQSYSDLVSEMGDWLNRIDLANKIPTFIQLFETRMNRRLRAPDQEMTATQTIISGTNVYPLPAAMRQVKHVFTSDSPLVELTFMSYEDLRRSYPLGVSDIPQAYSIVGNTITLQPIPTAGTLTIIGYAGVSALNSGNASNWLLASHPDAYLFGSLCESALFLRDDERMPVWRAAWDEALAEIEREMAERKIPSGPVASRPAVWE